MTSMTTDKVSVVVRRWSGMAVMLLGMLFQPLAQAFTLKVVGPDGMPIANGYRWLLEEDASKLSVPGVPAAPGTSYSLGFHTSYMPVVATGNQSTPTIPVPDAAKRYFISVLPDSGYSISGAEVNAGQTDVVVTVNPLPLPTAQISVFIFNDNHPINNAPDLPGEEGLPNFTIQLYEAGGSYGASGGQVSQDVFGNPLGTTYNADGTVLAKGKGIIKTDANGVAIIKNLAPAKYTIFVVPPAGSDWHQTATIEGTKGIDAWVKANEPPFFVEFGPPGHHVFVGFVNKINDTTRLTGGSAITGRVVNMHSSRPPEFAFYNGHIPPNCWIGLNDLQVAGGQALYAQPCKPDGSFAIPNVPAGNYELVIWDEALDFIFARNNVTVPPGGGEVALLEIPVFNWFGQLEGSVFYDTNGNGFREAGEPGIGLQNLNLRFRDGSIYQMTATDPDGTYVFPEVFPFFNWLVAEVDYARLKPTGVTYAVDNGGPIMPDQGWTYPSRNKLNPQPQYCTAADVAASGCTLNAPLVNPNTTNNLSRTETGPILLEGIQTFLSQTNVIDWGKRVYAPGENGGVTGIVYYATTRAEDEARYAVADPWEPGIPRVQVNLYRDCNGDGIIDKPDCSANGTANSYTLADVDNWPFGWSTGSPKGAEDVDRNGNGTFDKGDAYDVATTDSWDDSVPTGCQGAIFVASNGAPTDCYDGLRNFNQIRPGVFDGGYAFGRPAGKPDLPDGAYIVEAITPSVYKIQAEESKNVVFGDKYKPSMLLLPPVCVGDTHIVPAQLSLFPGEPAVNAGQSRPSCGRKQVRVATGVNAAADFFMYTDVPVAAHVVGMILNDLANEFDPNAPTFGEKQAPAYVPVSFRDWTGREITRVHADQWGLFNALLPSTYTINPPMPSGVSPNMVTACMNSPTMADPANPGKYIIDPYFNRQFSQFCYTFQYMPGKTTYLDTPVLPVAAFAGPGNFPVDCDFADGTPMIYSATGRIGAVDVGPYVPEPTTAAPQSITIVSMGSAVNVPNPAYNGSNSRFVARDFGFGATQGTVKIGNTNLTVTSWTSDLIVADVPPGTASGELTVTRGDNNLSTVTSVTFTVGGPEPVRVAAGQSIQAAINIAQPGALITVAPGIYEELPIMHKPVRLQGWGPGSTIINAAKFPAEKLQNWRNNISALLAAGAFDLLPGQAPGPVNPQGNEPMLFNTEEGAGVTVLGNVGEYALVADHARIDGFTITGSDHGGGIFVNGYADNLEISNNRLVGNNGVYSGGIRLGSPFLTNGDVFTDAQNNRIRIHHNQVVQNGSTGGIAGSGGGGIALYTGAHRYQVTENFVCGNFSNNDGGGIAHIGLSNDGLIARNSIVFNQNFNQGIDVSGGGVFVGGRSVNPNQLTTGSGSVTIDSNLIQGNHAGAGDGGGIRTQFVNGLDVQGKMNEPGAWHKVTIANNMIVDNVAGLAGGGISMQDTALIDIVNNTIAHNDSTATTGTAFAAGNPNQSIAQPAGVVSRAHSEALAAAFGNLTRDAYGLFSNPRLLNNIIWHNRSFYWAITMTPGNTSFGLYPAGAPVGAGPGTPMSYDDLAVLAPGVAGAYLNPRNSVLSAISEPDGHNYDASNIVTDPMFVSRYYNEAPGQTVNQTEFTTAFGFVTAPAFDEGGNWINVNYGPLTLFDPVTRLRLGDYHLQAASPALNAGDNAIMGQMPVLGHDYDNEPRPAPAATAPDIGADEVQ